MKIALLTDGIYPYVLGGMQRHSFYLTKYLAAAGHQVELYHTNQSEFDIDALEFFSEKEKKNIVSIVVPFPSTSGIGHYIRDSYEYSRRIFMLFKDRNMPDFIYVKGFAGWELLNKKSKGEKFPPIGLNFHGYEMFQSAPSFREWIKQKMLLRSPVLFNVKNADLLFSYGGKITSIIRSLGVAEQKIIVIPTGISEDWLNEKRKLTKGKVKFVFCGRYERRKGVKELMVVLNRLSQEQEKFDFHFVGPIPDNKKLILPNITYHGEIRDNEKMRSLLREMDVLVCPSYAEGMPNVIMEAMASGLAVIATDTGATSEMVNKENGWCIPPGKAESLKQAMTKAIVADPAMIDAMKTVSSVRVEKKFMWKLVIDTTIKEIEAHCFRQ